MEHIPSWLSPEFEEGWRFTGSGFAERAEWTIRIGVGSDDGESAEPLNDGSKGSGVMNRVKAMLSEHLGVPPEFIEIDVRVKI